MIITRTPFRVSLAGGGSDIASYYRSGFGAAVSATINKYMYITVNRRFDRTIRLSYSRTETAAHADELQHGIVRECMKMVGIDTGIEITSIADIPAGTGLGSSSSFTVGLLNSLYTYIGQQRSAHELAVKACEIEIDALGAPIGKQDQFAAAYGGLNYYRFNADESVEYEKIGLGEMEADRLGSKLMLFFTGTKREANEILADQQRYAPRNRESLDFIRDEAARLRGELSENGVTAAIGASLHAGWLRKKSLSEAISNPDIDRRYGDALGAGAAGGKLLGAGGGGFLLIYCDEQFQDGVREAVGLREVDFHITRHGSRVVFIGDE
ncbi:MAG: GHMP kinase [Clostridiales Family XIII bacterium]|jgi:D-glycero-alpha-D-manno-heptose-7-phosphate kinase|nr:GHMP kinase [Clostridiales Family XIII bacterium]